MKRPNCPKCGRGMIRRGKAPSGRTRWACVRYVPGSTTRAYCYSTTDSKATAVRKQDGSTVRKGKTPVFKRTLGGATRFLITAAQNATPVHAAALEAAKQYCNHNNAELLVVPIRYKNPTSRWTQSQANEEVWSPELVPHLVNQRIKLNRNLVLLGDIKTQPTAVNPLSGFDAITAGESGILAHTKLELKTIATPQHLYPKILTTTGAITKPNYTDTKAGKLGEFHHYLGACVVELDRQKFHLRQVGFDKKNGSFFDLDTIYGASWNAGKPYPGIELAALNMGDTHVGFTDPRVEKATFGPGGIVETLRPKKLIWHDIFDGYACNPHHRLAQDPFIGRAKWRGGRTNVRGEVERSIEFIVAHTVNGVQSVVVFSNHNDFLRRWVTSKAGANDPENMDFYHELAARMAKGAKMEAWGATYPDPYIDCVEEAVAELNRKDIICLRPDQSYMINGIEHGFHGHDGPNGARGSRRNMRRMGVKSIIEHNHSPGIDEGCWQGGTSTYRRAEYTRGPSSWLNTHVGQYNSGKRVLINIIGDDWRLA